MGFGVRYAARGVDSPAGPALKSTLPVVNEHLGHFLVVFGIDLMLNGKISMGRSMVPFPFPFNLALLIESKQIETKIRFEKISRDVYADAWIQYGGSFITHPNVLQTLEHIVDFPVTYFGLYRGDTLLGAIPTWNGWIAGQGEGLNKKSRSRLLWLDPGQPEYILPIEPSIAFSMPFFANRLSELHRDQIYGLQLMSGSCSRQALAKPIAGDAGSMSGVTRKKHNQRLRKFQEAGGQISPLSELSIEEMAASFERLYALQRSGQKPQGYEMLKDVLHQWQGMIFGNFLHFNGRVIAIDIAYCVTSSRCVYIETVQGAWDGEYSRLSPGTVLMFANMKSASAKADALEVPLRFSYGYTDEGGGNYKDIAFTHRGLYQIKMPRDSVLRRFTRYTKRLGKNLLGTQLCYQSYILMENSLIPSFAHFL